MKPDSIKSESDVIHVRSDYKNRMENVLDWKRIRHLFKLGNFGIYRLIASRSPKLAHAYRAGLIGMLTFGAFVHVICCAAAFYFKKMNAVVPGSAATDAVRFASFFLLPATVIFAVFFFITAVVQIAAFAGNNTPYPKWCLIFNGLSGFVVIAVMKLIGNYPLSNALSTGWISLGSIFMLSGLLIMSKKAEGAETFQPDGHDIVFENVSFAYDDHEVLRGVSLTAKEGEVTALVGPSGSGKSTCARLAARLWDINGGKIKVGGVDISTVDPEVLLTDYSMVFQDVVLFDDTVMENIRLGKHGAGDEEVRAAAKGGSGYGWRYTWHKDDPKDEFRFECNECIYQKILGKRGLLKLGAMCCQADVINCGNLPYTDFIRTQTLCKGGDCCDFRFVRHTDENFKRHESV